MRIALISDIHGNLVALEAVLTDIKEEHPDQIVCLGDVAAIGPQPREVIAQLKALNCSVVMGNTDVWLLNPPPLHEVTDENSRRVAEIVHWGAEQLSPADLDFLRTFQPTVEMPLGDGASLLCYHGSPHSNTDRIESTTSEDELDRMLAGFNATVMAGGHTHAQMLRRHRDVIVINPGSVSFQLTGHIRKAEYGLVSWQDSHLSIELRRVSLDVNAVIQAAHDSGMPHAQWWAGKYWG